MADSSSAAQTQQRIDGAMLEDAVEQPLTFSFPIGANWNPSTSSEASATPVLLDCRRLLWKSQPPGGGLCAAVPPPPPPPPPPQQQAIWRNEPAYRDWLIRRHGRQFQPYLEAGGMPNRLFLDLFNRASAAGGRKRKLARLLRRAESDLDGRTSWADFYAGMTYRMRSEVAPAKRLVNRLVRAADPGVAAAERRLRQRRVRRRRTGGRRDAGQRGGRRHPDAVEPEDEPGDVPDEAYIELYRCRPPPVLIPLALLAAWIGFCVSAVQLNAGPAWNRVGWASGLPYASPLAFCPSRRHEVWRFATYALLHDGWQHLAFNTIILLLLGLPLQLAHGALRIGAVLLGGVLLGSLLSSVVEPGAVLVGAAGATFALIGAHIGLALVNWGQLSAEWRQLTAPNNPLVGELKRRGGKLRQLLTGCMTRLVLLVGLAYADFGVAVYQRHWRGLSSYAAQPAGLAWGCLVGAQLLSIDQDVDYDNDEDDSGRVGESGGAGGLRRRQQCQRALLRVSLIGFAVFVAFAVLWNVFNAGWYLAAGGLACGAGETRAG